MNYKECDFKKSYISYGEENFAACFLNPALQCTKLYKRSVGFFSSGVLLPIIDGIVGLYRNGGKILLAASPKLNKEDIEAINAGYRLREEIIKDAFTRDFTSELEAFDDSKLNLLVELISNSVLDIKIIVTHKDGMYHDKLGILEDFDGNKIVFYGSPNSSYNGYETNYEKIRLSKSWDPAAAETVEDEEQEFESIWNGTNPFLEVYEYRDTAKAKIIEVQNQRQEVKTGGGSITLRDYQKEAIQAWVDNDYNGFYVMATGTGKTWTAIYSAKELLKEHEALLVICAPYKHLIKQWVQDLEKTFPDSKIIMVSSENPTWDKQLTEAIIRKRYKQNEQIIVVSTIASFNRRRFFETIQKSDEDKLLIVDEAHRFTKRFEQYHRLYKFMLGLSATPYGGKSAQSGKELMDYFGGQVYNLPIEVALERKFLVPYYYHPIFVYATEYEEELFKSYTQKMLSCWKDGVLIDPENFAKFHRGRLRVISMAEEKMDEIRGIIKAVSKTDHFIVYCGDGKLFDNDTGEEIRHIQAIKNILTEMDYKASQFTAQENMKERMQLIEAFNTKKISTLVAIRCLDEGINIPSIESALILSSNDSYREFVQRRGRILRRYPGKEHADIFDVIVLPSQSNETWAAIEFRRFYEYAHLALNWKYGLEKELDDYISEYALEEGAVKAFNYDEVEDALDE